MRILGIDYGSRKIGLALTNSEGQFAAPHSVIINNHKTISIICALIKEKEVEKIVVGKSLNFKREENPIMKKIVPFSEELRKITGLHVILWDETLTTAAAQRTQEADTMLDARAAALILESYITKKIPSEHPFFTKKK